MKYPFVSVVVGIRNEEKFIEECIESLLNLDYPRDSYEIIIVDGMSTDKTRDIVQKYPVKLLLNEQRMLLRQETLVWRMLGENLSRLLTETVRSIISG